MKELDDEIELLRREITEMVKLGSADESIGWSIGSIWAAKELRTRFICVLVLHVVNQLTGINAVNNTSSHKTSVSISLICDY